MGGTLSVVSTQPLPDLAVKSSAPLPSTTLSPAEVARQRTLSNMTAAMSGQPMQNPEDQAQAEEGKKAGMRAAAETTGAMIGGEAVPAVRGLVGALLRVLGTGTGGGIGNILGQLGTTGTVDPAEAAKAGGRDAALQAGGEGLGALGGAFGEIKSALGKLIYTPKGTLTPLAKAIVHPTTLPETMLRNALPPPEPTVAPAVPITKSPNFDAAAYRAGRASVNPAPEPAPANPFGNATATDASSASSLPTRPLPSAGDIPQGNSTPFGQPQLVSKFTPPESGRIQAPNSPAPAINKTLVSYDRRLLVEMAKGGDLNALRELIRNPGGIDVATAVPNSKYLLEGNQPTSIYGGPK